MDRPGLFPSSMSPRGWLICACPLLRLELSSLLQEFVEIRNKSGKIRENRHKSLQLKQLVKVAIECGWDGIGSCSHGVVLSTV